jgi:hypothetical protein
MSFELPTRWESTKTSNINIETLMKMVNQLGEAAWELVTVTVKDGLYTAFLKRTEDQARWVREQDLRREAFKKKK